MKIFYLQVHFYAHTSKGKTGLGQNFHLGQFLYLRAQPPERPHLFLVGPGQPSRCRRRQQQQGQREQKQR